MIIVGAGLAGMLAAHAWPQALVVESSEEPKAEHKALLRFRSDAVARLTGLDFRKVTVRKGIWLDGDFVQPSIRAANMYASKVTGSLVGDRSIWNLDSVERFIAPETIYHDLLANVKSRVAWGFEFQFGKDPRRPVINTAPLPIVLERLCDHPDFMSHLGPNDFKRAPITVHRFRIQQADIYQTVYFPWPEIAMYRASMTGSLLIIECVAHTAYNSRCDHDPAQMLEIALKAFGIEGCNWAPLDSVEQKYGKIIPLPDADRKSVLHDLTRQYGIFSLGRFATWRNVLLDDVVQDIAVVRRLLKSTDYDRRMHAS